MSATGIVLMMAVIGVPILGLAMFIWAVHWLKKNRPKQD